MSAFRPLAPGTLLSPTPAVLVSCRGTAAQAKPNLLTVAWAGTVCSDPPMVGVGIRPDRYSHPLIVESGEFVVNLVDAAHCRALDYCGVKSGRDVDKWAQTGLTPIPARNLDWAPAVAQCPAYLSCKVRQVLHLGSHDLFLGEVVGVEAQSSLFGPEGDLHLEGAGLVSYSHGVYQCLSEPLGFFGYSLAREDVRKRRMAAYWPAPREG